MSTIKRLPIELFIENFKKGFDENSLIRCFTEGNCYHFTVILKNIYDEGRIIHDPIINHFLLEFDHKYYDITGEVQYKEDYDNFEYMDDLMKNDKDRYTKLLRDCVFKIECFHGIENDYYKESERSDYENIIGCPDEYLDVGDLKCTPNIDCKLCWNKYIDGTDKDNLRWVDTT